MEGGRERGRGRERGGRGREGGGGKGMTNLYHLPFHLKVVSSIAIRSESYILQRKTVATIKFTIIHWAAE